LAQSPDIEKVAELVFSGGTALAGLVLVYIGFLTNAYQAYRPLDRPAVRAQYQRLAVFALIGFTASLLAAVLGLISYWLGCGFIYAGLVFLAISFVTVFVMAISSVAVIR